MQQKDLINLPDDVLHLIVQSLTIGPLFTPRYADEDFGYLGQLSEYTAKRKEYYGPDREDNDARAQGLLNWSVTSKRFRMFLSPYLFKTVVLRDKSRSIASMKYLFRSPYWNYVQHFIFASTWDVSQAKMDGNGDERFGATDTRDDLSMILSNLPPNLQSLTLDVPEGDVPENCYDAWEQDNLDDPVRPDTESETSPYRIMLRNVLTSVSVNDFSKNPNFELRLLNVPPYHSLAYDFDNWRKFLTNVTSFTLGLKHWHNHQDWMMIIHEYAREFASNLGMYFFDNLDRVQSFALLCDKSWPLGAPNDLEYPRKLPLPPSRAWHNLRHVSFKETFIGTPLVEFLHAHLDTIETMELIDCFAPAVPEGWEGCESWSSFFKGLADVKPLRLRDLKISYMDWDKSDFLDGFIYVFQPKGEIRERREKVRDILKEQEVDLERNEHSPELIPLRERQRKMLAYCGVQLYGSTFLCEDRDLRAFLEGQDHKQWLRLLEVIVRNRESTAPKL